MVKILLRRAEGPRKRPGHHKILVGVTGKKGPRGGTTEKIGGLREYKR